MGRFDNALSRAIRRSLIGFGESVTISTKAGDRLMDITVHIETDVEFTDGETQTLDKRHELEVMLADVGELKRGDEVHTTKQKVWRIERTIENNGSTQKCQIMEVTG